MPSPLDGKTFVLGIGAQKAGTSWLADYLEARPEVYISPLKEVHYFETKYVASAAADVGRLFRKRRGILRRQLIVPTRKRRERLAHVNARLAMMNDADYVAYFERYAPASCSHFGEVTPAYSLLGREGFEDIARCFDRPRLIFILRDPVDRFYSQLRMNMRAGRLPNRSEADLFAEALESPTYCGRTFYHETFDALRTVFAADQVHIAFYEELFGDAEISRMCEFLGLAFIPGAYDEKSNAAPRPARLDPKLADLARARFAPVYDFCRAEFGDRVPAAWRL